MMDRKHGECVLHSKARTPLSRFVVDFLYNWLYDKSTTIEVMDSEPE